MTKIVKKLQLKFFFFYQKLQFSYPMASIKNVQVTEEAFSSKKREHSTLQNMKFKKKFYFCGSFLLS
jgi:hypothetical protein